MLRSFRVANHRSIRDEQELVLIPAYDKAQRVTPVVAIFGANASGKSNLLDAIAFMQEAVRTSFAQWEAGSGVPRNRFRLDPKKAKDPSIFTVDLLIDGVQYGYGFAAASDRIVEEWLYSYPHRRKRVIFERDAQGIVFGSTVPDHRARSEFMAGLTRDNALLLSAAVQAKQDVVAPVYEWFRRSLRFSQRTELVNVGRVVKAMEEHKGLVDLLRAADLGIVDLRAPSPEERASIERRLQDALDRAFAADNRVGSLKMSADADSLSKLADARAAALKAWEEVADWESRLSSVTASGRTRLEFLHGGHRIPLGVEDQSAGTLAWLAILIDAMDALSAGAVLIVDEIDSSLHPHLTARLIGLFQEPATNPHGAQLIFTTHDATLLSPALGDDTLKRDQVWFIEKEDSGASRLFPLSDFHPRTGENTARRYLGGSYGAIPSTSEYEFRTALLGLVDHRDQT